MNFPFSVFLIDEFSYLSMLWCILLGKFLHWRSNEINKSEFYEYALGAGWKFSFALECSR